MNKETEAAIKLIEQLANASAALKKNIDAYSNEAKNSRLEFKEIIKDYQSYVKDITNEANQNLSSVMKQSITTSVEASSEDITKGIQKSTNILLNTIDEFQKTQKNLVGQTKWLSWKSLIIFLVGLTILFGTVFKISGDEYRHYLSLKEENENLKNAIRQKHAILKTEVMVCGDTPCIKLDVNSKRWGSKGEYLLIESLH